MKFAAAVRPSLLWGALGTLGLSAVAIWLVPQEQDTVVQASLDVQRPVELRPPANSPSGGAGSPAVPSALATPLWNARSSFDPFAGVQAPPPKPPASVATPPVEVRQAAPAPVAPTLAHRYFGRMTGPQGDSVVYLVRDGRTVAVEPGTQLDDGFMVERMDAAGIYLVHALARARVTIPLPATSETSLQ